MSEKTLDRKDEIGNLAASFNDMKNNLKDRTKQFALRVIRLCEALPKGETAKVIGGQLLRCGTSVGANYRAACRARSTTR